MNKLEAWKRKNGIKDREIAEAIGVERSVVCKMRHGKHLPILKVAVALERFTEGEVPVETWVDGADDGVSAVEVAFAAANYVSAVRDKKPKAEIDKLRAKMEARAGRFATEQKRLAQNTLRACHT